VRDLPPGAGAATAKAEADRCYDLAKAREARADRVKASAIEVMQQLGVKFVKGDVSELRRWGNGGAHPVEVRQPELLPEKYQRYELRMTGEQLEALRNLCEIATWNESYRVLSTAKPIDPDSDLIRKDLLAEVAVPGAVLVDRGEHLRVK